jgi:hypothetical protein
MILKGNSVKLKAQMQEKVSVQASNAFLLIETKLCRKLMVLAITIAMATLSVKQ